MSKHTPGPWLGRGKSDSVHRPCDTHPYGDQIFAFHPDYAPNDADHSLILAAPKLLAALERLTAAARDADVGYLDAAVSEAEDVLAEAKGEQP